MHTRDNWDWVLLVCDAGKIESTHVVGEGGISDTRNTEGDRLNGK